jgi:hypothetical protein
MTRDDGAHWTNVTPKGLPVWAKIASVEVSDVEDGVAYIAVDNQRQDDASPRAYVTRDYGASWREIGQGLPAGRFASVVRADSVKPGLIYAGTETGVFVSFDDGAHWRPLGNGLPTAWVRDLTVHGDDLVAATQGRAIWVLDNLTPLRQGDSGAPATSARLFAPAPAFRLRPSNNRDTPLAPEEPVGANPPDGAVIDYWLPKAVSHLSIEIRDGSGELVQVLSDQPSPKLPSEPYFHSDYIRPPAPLSKTAGAHRTAWNLRWTRPMALSYGYSIAAVRGMDTPMTPGGAYALPGEYKVRLVADGKPVGEAKLTLKPDPRTRPDPAALGASLALSKDIAAAMTDGRRAAGEAQGVKNARADRKTADPAVSAKLAAAATWVKDAKAIEAPMAALAGVETDLEGTDQGPTEPQKATVTKSKAALKLAVAAWSAHVEKDLPALNAALKKAGLKPVALPDGSAVELAGGEAGEDLP